MQHHYFKIKMTIFNKININKRKLGIFFAIFIGLIFMALGTLYYFRESLLQQAIAKISMKMKNQYNSTFVVKTAKFDGLATVTLTNVSLVPHQADTLFKVQKIKTSISFARLFLGQVQLDDLELKNGLIQLISKNNHKNFEAFLKKEKNTDVTQTASEEKIDYASFANDLISKIFRLVPTNMKIQNLWFKIDDNGKKASLNLSSLSLENEQLETAIKIKTNTFEQRWRITGLADPRRKTANIRFFNMDTGAIKLPYFDERFNLKASFDSIQLNLDNIEMDGDELHIDGYTAISNLKVNHQKIASKDVVIKNARFDYRLLLGSDFVSIDSTSILQLNKVAFQPYVSYQTAEDTIYKLKINVQKTRAQDFINSLPDGLFTNFKGMMVTGNFDYNLDFSFNKNKPDDLIFESKLNKENLKILQFGKAKLNKINSDFVYRAIIKDNPQRPILVGLANANYTPMDKISPYLQKCLLTTEDPSFFKHKGFVTEAFKQSIIQNIKTKKFSRGASTISMQLVKNVFLTREKTLSRKLEEILLVYILENNRIVSKQRMLEVYFNIIEWGPDVYGIGEASRFYFQKAPIDLNFNECLFLATIVPSPKKFMYKFNNQGNLSNRATNMHNYITNLMIKRGLLDQVAINNRYQSIYVSGRARGYLNIIKLQDSSAVAVDSLDEEPLEIPILENE